MVVLLESVREVVGEPDPEPVDVVVLDSLLLPEVVAVTLVVRVDDFDPEELL